MLKNEKSSGVSRRFSPMEWFLVSLLRGVVTGAVVAAMVMREEGRYPESGISDALSSETDDSEGLGRSKKSCKETETSSEELISPSSVCLVNMQARYISIMLDML
jgi:hypothetical protein